LLTFLLTNFAPPETTKSDLVVQIEANQSLFVKEGKEH